MSEEKLWKATAKCQVCDAVLNTALHVPEHEKGGVGMSAPLVAICDVKDHNTLSDCNIGVKIEWEEEPVAILPPTKAGDSLHGPDPDEDFFSGKGMKK